MMKSAPWWWALVLVGCVSTAPTPAFGSGKAALDLDAPLAPDAPGKAEVQFTVRSDRGRHPISPGIYGTNQPLRGYRYGLVRFGGNRLTAYNWENNASNAGSDYGYQNDGYLSQSNTPGEAVSERLRAARVSGARFLATVPIVDFVAADKRGDGDVRQSPDFRATRLKENRAQKGAPLARVPDLRDGVVNQDEFIAWLKAAAGETKVSISLDNEPDLWSDTHPEVHPEPVGYAELLTRTTTFARMIKQLWPEAKVTGFVSYGFNGFVTLQNAPDRAGKGEFIDYFLSQLKAAEQAEGRRLVDELDLHWYPEARGGNVRIIGEETSPEVVEARLQAPRSLWDPTYVEQSWVQRFLGGPVKLLPRLQAQIDKHYPGTGLAITEWNYGGGNHISGALASADVLGIFGREGVQTAALWKLHGEERFNEAALSVFRDFDGEGARFGDTSLEATTSDAQRTSLYASVDAADPGRVVLVAINKSEAPTSAALTLAHPLSYTRLEVFTLTAKAPVVRRGEAVKASGKNAFLYSLPPRSVSVLVPRP